MVKRTPMQVVKPEPESERVDLGQWYWVKSEAGDGGDQLTCVTWIGSNYVELQSPGGYAWRIHVDEWVGQIGPREWHPEVVIETNVTKHRAAVNDLMNKIKQLTAQLGLTPVGELTDGQTETSTALVAAHNAQDVKAHKKALIRAKEETLPDLFARVQEHHEGMSTWLKARLLPMITETKVLKKRTESIDDRIFTVELYAGLTEELKLIRGGEPAGNDEKVHLFQRRHYMDEECLVDYQAGGMEFKNIREFDRWLMKKRNRERILPLPKCVVAFQVRRNQKAREKAVSLSSFINLMALARADKSTFLYVRNGQRFYRLSTSIDFGPELFPDAARSALLGGQLYVSSSFHNEVISEQEYNDIEARDDERDADYQSKLAEWKKMSKAERQRRIEPRKPHRWGRYIPLTPGNVYYDDAMGVVAEKTRDFNRIAVVLQGLLDRSPAFQPHPPWRLWTPEGFAAGIELHHDGTRAISDGDPPDFEAYRDRLNASIKMGTNTVGQRDAWRQVERDKYDASGRRMRGYYGDPGPDQVSPVIKISRDRKTCHFRWGRERQWNKWVRDPERPGYQKRDTTPIGVCFSCATSGLFNVDAYTPGDFKQFYADPRTRADYLQWAPLLLAAEDWHAKKGNSDG